MISEAASSRAQPGHWRRYRALYALLAVCVAPVVASYLAYYALAPAGRTNYGELIDPQRPLPAGLNLRHLDGSPVAPESLRGRWLMVMTDEAACDETCQRKLWLMRQVRLTTGKDRDRIERAFLVADDAPLATMLLREYDGTRFLRADRAQLQSFLALPAGGQTRLADHVWIIDPLGNLMLRWPPGADPNQMKKDLARLLKASRIG